MKSNISSFKKPVTTILFISLVASVVMSFGLVVEKGACDQSTTTFYGVEIANNNVGPCVGGNKEILIGGMAPYSIGCATCTPVNQTASDQTNQALTIGSAYLSAILVYMTLFLTISMITYWTARQAVKTKR